ncbi:FAD-dependent oxidoreductase [Nocardia sp. CWNU-33]|uniref:FAD-dependent oxidoreductase n=1 Tax=Nocardia sp. CWNU-33 TaxID=3392117 RepID=UPI00398F2CEE
MDAIEGAAQPRDEEQVQRAVVVGAGIAGLAAALRLHQQGWDVLMVERAQGRRSSGYLVNLHGPGYDAAERLGLLPALAPRDIGFFTSILVHADGREKLTVPAGVAQTAVGGRALTVFRGDLESVLYEALADAVAIRFGTTVQAVTQNPGEVDITLSDGDCVQAELLIGADGLHSRIRELVFDTEVDCLVNLRHWWERSRWNRFPSTFRKEPAPRSSGPGARRR